MKILFGAVALLLVLSGCAAQESSAPVALQTQGAQTTESSPAETSEMEETQETEPAETESGQSPEPTAEPSAEATTQARETTTASPAPTAATTATPTPTSTPSPTPTPTSTETVVAGYTMADVRMNNTSASCWVAIDGRVYDLTQWVSRHPGGAGVISQLCGTDGTAAFSARHGGQPSPSATLDSYDLGPLR